jgi:hypothetical protein
MNIFILRQKSQYFPGRLAVKGGGEDGWSLAISLEKCSQFPPKIPDSPHLRLGRNRRKFLNSHAKSLFLTFYGKADSTRLTEEAR